MVSNGSKLAALFAVHDYRRLWSMGAGLGIARWLEFLALGIFAYQLTSSPTLVALLAIIRMLPNLMLGFIIGALADHLDRPKLLVISYALAAASSLTMAVVAVSGLAAYWTLAVAAAIAGTVWITDMPVRRRLVVEAAGAERMSSALGFDNTTQHVTRAIGPLLGGVIYQWLGITGIFALTSVVYALCLVLALRLMAQHRAAATTTLAPSTATIRLLPPMVLLKDPRFLVVLGVTAVYNLWCFPFITMVPVIAQKDFALAPIAIGALSACDGVGGTIGALVIGMLASNRALFPLYYLGTAGFLVAMLGISLALDVATTAMGLILIGIGAAGFTATQYALVYLLAPPEARGRATGFLSLFIGLSTVGHYMTGRLFETMPTAPAIQIMVACGLAALFILGVVWWRQK